MSPFLKLYFENGRKRNTGIMLGRRTLWRGHLAFINNTRIANISHYFRKFKVKAKKRKLHIYLHKNKIFDPAPRHRNNRDENEREIETKELKKDQI